MTKWGYVAFIGLVLVLMYIASWWYIHELSVVSYGDVEVNRIKRTFPNGYSYDVVDKIRTAIGYGPSSRVSEEWFYNNYYEILGFYWPINHMSFKVRSDVTPDEKIRETEN